MGVLSVISTLESSLGLLWIPIVLATIPIWRIICNVFFHPLHNYPGPMLAAASGFYYAYWTSSGKIHSKTKELHDQYGDVVRIGPNMLVYRNATAWEDIYGTRKHAAASFPKHPAHYTDGRDSGALLTADDQTHARQRKVLANMFSGASLREQEPILHNNIDRLVNELHQKAETGIAPDMIKWYNYTMLDIIGDLTFGESFGCLQGSQHQTWIESVVQNVKADVSIRPLLSLLPGPLIKALVPKKLIQLRERNHSIFTQKLNNRLRQQRVDRPDLVTYVLKRRSENDPKFTEEEMQSNARLLTIVGSETVATQLSGCTFLFLTHPPVYKRLVEEIRTAFRSQHDITLSSVAKLSYMQYVIYKS